jgi:hypothetical protein
MVTESFGVSVIHRILVILNFANFIISDAKLVPCWFSSANKEAVKSFDN